MPAARSAWQIFWATRYGPVANGGRGSDSDSDLFESRAIHTPFGSNHRSTVMDQLIHTPSVDRKTAIGSLVTPQWLAARSSEPHNDVAVPVCSPEAKRLLRQKLSDPNEAVRALDGYLSDFWTDDYPRISVDVTFHGGRTLHVESSRQQAL